MSSDTVAIEVVGVRGRTVEFWAAEIPRGGDGAFASSLGNDHPVFGLMVLIDSGGRKHPLARRLEGAAVHEPAWYAAHLAEYIDSVELVMRRPLPYSYTGREVAEAIHARHDTLRAVLDLAPGALYRVTVHDAADVAHLRARDVFASTAFSPAAHGARHAKWALATVGDGALAPVLAALARVPENPALHVFRSFIEHDVDYRGKPLIAGAEESMWPGWEGQARVRTSNRVRELFLCGGSVQLLYFDATAPGFKPGKHRFKQGAADPLSLGGRSESGPRGFSMSPPWRFGNAVRGPDGVARLPLDYGHPGGIAWIDLEGEPRVRVSPAPLFNAACQPAVIDPALPSVDVDVYLAEAAARIAHDVEHIGRGH